MSRSGAGTCSVIVKIRWRYSGEMPSWAPASVSVSPAIGTGSGKIASTHPIE